MTTWYESHIDRQIREARERGDFDDLPGAGKPLPGYGESYDEDWWIKDLVRRENITGVLPASMLLRKEAEDLMRTLAAGTAGGVGGAGKASPTESSVREAVAELNERIRDARRGLVGGPPVVLRTLDADEVVRVWREGTGPTPAG